MSTRRRVLALVVVLCAVLALPWHSLLGSVEAQSGTAIQVDVAANRRPIDPRVYGVNWADAAQLAALNVPVHRWGGNSTTRHNWKTNGDNRGSDWYFESIPGSGAQGAAFDDFVQLSKQNGSEPMVTIPLIGWVGKNGPGGTKLASFSAAKYGAQQDCDWSWYPDACNGVRTNGTKVTGNDPNDANVASNAQYQKEWAQHLVTRWGLAASGGVRYYIYDNEPSLWHHTHRDVHPAGQTMTELRDLMIAYGTAIRQADPGAVFVGPEEWGWSGYFLSGYDQKYGAETGCWSCAPDKTANGGVDFMPWLLAQMRQHEQSTGNRLLHVFTLHYYPQGGEFGSDTSVSMQALPEPLHPLAVGPELHRRDVDRRQGPPHPADEGVGERQLPRPRDRHHRVQLGRRRPHQRRDRPGRRARHLRPRGPQRGHPVGGPGHGHAHVQGHPDVPQLRRREVHLRRRQREGDGAQPGQPRGLRRGALERRRRHRDGHQQGRRRAPSST